MSSLVVKPTLDDARPRRARNFNSAIRAEGVEDDDVVAPCY